MFKCDDCKNLFEEPAKEYVNQSPEYTEEINVCPICGSDEIELAEKCSLCGEYEPCDCEKNIYSALDQTLDIIKAFYKCDNKDITSYVEEWLESRF